MPCQWYVRGGGEGNRRILMGQSVPPTPIGMPFGRLKLWALGPYTLSLHFKVYKWFPLNSIIKLGEIFIFWLD
jgi:hypothetical protein